MPRILMLSLLSLLLVAGRCSGPKDVPLGDLVLHVDTVSRRPLHRGRVELTFAATLRNPTAVDLGDVVVDATSRDRTVQVVEGRLRFPALRAGETRAAVGRLVVRQHALGVAPRLAYAIASAAPPLLSSTPADRASDFARTDWPVLQFASQPAGEAAAGFGLSCGGAALPFAAHALATDSLLLNPAPELPAGAACQLGWVGPGHTIHQLVFATAAAGSAAVAAYDRSDPTRDVPLPDDYFTGADSSSPTGLRVQLPVPAVDSGSQVLYRAVLAKTAGLDGFSPHGPFVLRLSDVPDPSRESGIPSGRTGRIADM
jgi:hypothetical protein